MNTSLENELHHDEDERDAIIAHEAGDEDEDEEEDGRAHAVDLEFGLEEEVDHGLEGDALEDEDEDDGLEVVNQSGEGIAGTTIKHEDVVLDASSNPTTSSRTIGLVVMGGKSGRGKR